MGFGVRCCASRIHPVDNMFAGTIISHIKALCSSVQAEQGARQSGGGLGGWFGRVTGTMTIDSEDEGTGMRQRGGTTPAGAASARPRWGSGLVTAISSTGRWAA